MPRIKAEEFTHEYVAENIDAVCVDTSTYERLDFAFATSVLERLSSLKDGRIKLLMVDLVEREVLSHLFQKANENVTGLRRAIRSARNYGLVGEEVSVALAFADFDSEQHARTHLDDFIVAAGIEIIKTADHTDVQRLIEDYFGQRPPFGGKRKKNEFPDAMALGALERWAMSATKRVLIISDDSDWTAFAEASEWLLCGPDLPDFLAKVPPGDAAMLARAGQDAAGGDFAAIRKVLEREVRGIPIIAHADSDHHVSIDVLEAGLSQLPIPRTDGSEFELIANEPGELAVRWRPEVTLWFEANAHFAVHDPYDRDYVRMPPIRLRQEVEVSIDVLLTFEVSHEDDNLNLQFETAAVVDDLFQIDIGYLKLDLSGTD